MRRLVLLNFVIVVAFGVGVFSTASAQTTQPAKSAPATRPITKAPAKLASANPNNQELIELVQGGASERNLLGAVAAAKAENRAYDKSAKEIITLTKAGVSDAVIEAIRAVATSPTSDTTNVPAPSAPVTVALGQTPIRSVEGRDAGIYIKQGKDLIQLEPSSYSGGATNKFFASIPIVGKSRLKAVIRSAKAEQRLQVAMPVFEFYFENRGVGLSNTGIFTGYMNGASSPNEFILVRLTSSKGERQVIIAEETHFNDRLGTRPEDEVPFSFKKLQPGVYEVTPKNPLTPGEYCFFYQGGGMAVLAGLQGGKLFDFGVDVGATIQQ